jgi:hypothetical protein
VNSPPPAGEANPVLGLTQAKPRSRSRRVESMRASISSSVAESIWVRTLRSSAVDSPVSVRHFSSRAWSSRASTTIHYVTIQLRYVIMLTVSGHVATFVAYGPNRQLVWLYMHAPRRRSCGSGHWLSGCCATGGDVVARPAGWSVDSVPQDQAASNEGGSWRLKLSEATSALRTIRSIQYYAKSSCLAA